MVFEGRLSNLINGLWVSEYAEPVDRAGPPFLFAVGAPNEAVVVRGGDAATIRQCTETVPSTVVAVLTVSAPSSTALTILSDASLAGLTLRGCLAIRVALSDTSIVLDAALALAFAPVRCRTRGSLLRDASSFREIA